jgi:hypothetical protein
MELRRWAMVRAQRQVRGRMEQEVEPRQKCLQRAREATTILSSPAHPKSQRVIKS